MRLHLTSIGDARDARASTRASCATSCSRSDVFDAEQRARIELNPMRAFDWDGPEVRAVTDAAPKMLDRLSDEDREHFEEVRRLLDGAGIDYEVDPRLVRGLDYYTRTVFEFRSDALGAQSGIGGGGRYDRLIEQIGGDPTPARRLGHRPRADRAGDGGERLDRDRAGRDARTAPLPVRGHRARRARARLPRRCRSFARRASARPWTSASAASRAR